MAVYINTSVGDFTIDLFTQECPDECKNFLRLCKSKYYNNCLFFKVEKGFVARTGDPTGTGKGGSSFAGLQGGPKRFRSRPNPKLRHTKIGAIGYIPDREGNGSSFYLTLRENVKHLDSKMALFGQLAEEEGLEALQNLNKLQCDVKGRPYQDVRIRDVRVVYDPFPDPPGHEYPDSPKRRVPDEETVELRIADDEEIDPNEGKTKTEMHAQMRAETAHGKAVALTLMGDMPHPEAKPEDNVIFVCGLNRVTNEEGLEIIFSAFGEITECNLVKERRTGESLQYAFISFATRKQAEEAYFKMDGRIVDGRRIKVDFSQSMYHLRGHGGFNPGRAPEHMRKREGDSRKRSRPSSDDPSPSSSNRTSSRTEARPDHKPSDGRSGPSHSSRTDSRTESRRDYKSSGGRSDRSHSSRTDSRTESRRDHKPSDGRSGRSHSSRTDSRTESRRDRKSSGGRSDRSHSRSSRTDSRTESRRDRKSSGGRSDRSHSRSSSHTERKRRR